MINKKKCRLAPEMLKIILVESYKNKIIKINIIISSIILRNSEMKFILEVVFLAVLTLASAEQARFDNYRVYNVHIANEKQLDVLKQMENGVRFIFFYLKNVI